MRIINVDAHHDWYDPSASFTGGSYFQPRGHVDVEVNGRTVTIHIDDLSCGWYGSRVRYSIGDTIFWIGSMDDNCIDPDYAAICISKLSYDYGCDFRAVIREALRALRRNSVVIEN